MAWLHKPSKNQQAPRHHFVGLLQLRVLRFGLLQDGDVWVGVFPEREEMFVGGERPGTSSTKY
jgi:hypothetical protein